MRREGKKVGDSKRGEREESAQTKKKGEGKQERTEQAKRKRRIMTKEK